MLICSVIAYTVYYRSFEAVAVSCAVWVCVTGNRRPEAFTGTRTRDSRCLPYVRTFLSPSAAGGQRPLQPQYCTFKGYVLVGKQNHGCQDGRENIRIIEVTKIID